MPDGKPFVSAMVPIFASSTSPTCGTPEIAGRPVALAASVSFSPIVSPVVQLRPEPFHFRWSDPFTFASLKAKVSEPT